jgi:tRNA-dihydrouridine synthase B
MIGRAAQGRPWIFREIAHYLATGATLPPPRVEEARMLIAGHLADHYDFYGEPLGVRIARKHLGWYTAALPGGAALRAVVNEVTSASAQLAAMEAFFDALARNGERLCYREATTDAADAARDVHASTRAMPTDRAMEPKGPGASVRKRAGEALAA